MGSFEGDMARFRREQYYRDRLEWHRQVREQNQFDVDRNYSVFFNTSDLDGDLHLEVSSMFRENKRGTPNERLLDSADSVQPLRVQRFQG